MTQAGPKPKDCRQLALVTSIDSELESRRSLPPEERQALQSVLPLQALKAMRAEAVSKELPASLEVIRIESYLVEAEVKCHRLLHIISSMPLGFDRQCLTQNDNLHRSPVSAKAMADYNTWKVFLRPATAQSRMYH